MNTNIQILETFLAAGEVPVSGAKLAEKLGISRVSVHARLEQLRSEGFVFEAATRVGYRLTGKPPVVHPALLAAELARLTTPAATAPALHVFRSTGSTNDDATRLLAAGSAAPLAVVASEQTAGRGRLGRVWRSDDPGSLYITYGFRPQLAPAQAQAVTLAVGLALCDALAERFGLPLCVKWPNDILCGGRKITGILAEARMDADSVRDIVIGVGVNVNRREFPPELRETAASLATVLGHDVDINATAALCVAGIHGACEQYAADIAAGGTGLDAAFHARWSKRDALAGNAIRARIAGSAAGSSAAGSTDTAGALAAIAVGISATGALLVRDAAGTVHALNSGEVTLAPAT